MPRACHTGIMTRMPSTPPGTPAPDSPRARAVPDAPPSDDTAVTAVTELLRAWGGGDPLALEALVPLVYGELREQARRALRREGEGHTLQATALVHEAWLRLAGQDRSRWESRSQFFGVAAQVMRRVLVDHARTKHAQKRGGHAVQVSLSDVASVSSVDDDAGGVDVLALDEALTRLAAFDPRKARLVELRYFVGLSIPEAAEALGISQATVGREWAVARLWLRRELSQ
jgi:RNA polymerase sigma-70 factor (ECF subfamily)